MSKPCVPDELWDSVEPQLPAEPPKPKGDRPRVPDRACLAGIIFVLKSGIPWEMLDRLGHADRIDWLRACLDSASVSAKRGATGPVRTRRIAANRARSATRWLTAWASRSPTW